MRSIENIFYKFHKHIKEKIFTNYSKNLSYTFLYSLLSWLRVLIYDSMAVLKIFNIDNVRVLKGLTKSSISLISLFTTLE